MVSLTVSLLTAVAAISPAPAADGGKVSSVTIADAHSTLTLAFDKPISSADAKKIRASASGQVITMSPQRVSCGGGGTFPDENGIFTYQYYCNGTTRTIPWGFKLSAANQATVVGNVTEKGLRWWCNGAFVGQNAPHTVPPSYHFHGTMNPVAAGCLIDFQDQFTWRHNIGPGGTAVLNQTGSLYLVN